jgi:hypothetical protein
MLKKYKVELTLTRYEVIEVGAKNEDEAEKLAFEEIYCNRSDFDDVDVEIEDLEEDIPENEEEKEIIEERKEKQIQLDLIGKYNFFDKLGV